MTDDEATCSLPDCAEPIKRKGFCYGHYMKQWRYGTPTPEFPSKVVDLVGQAFGSLVVVRRVGSKWECTCACGVVTTVRAGDLNRGTTTSCGDRRLHRRQEYVGYEGMHDRLQADRGSASQHSCVDCGGEAEHWSYDHADPDELASTTPKYSGMPYSLDPMHYDPRCVRCHRAFDRVDRARPTSARA